MKKIIWKILRKIGLAGSIQLYLQSALKEDGWFRSFHAQQPIDKNGNPLPWYCYSFIKFLAPRITPEMKVFEFGAGNSTLWYASKVKSITAVENNQEWVAKLTPLLPNNAKVIFRDIEKDKESYINEVKKEGILYDLIVVDGRRRNDCVMASLDCLSPKGVLVLDNAERQDYTPCRQFMLEKGFKCIDFHGMPVGSHINSITAIYYRPDNILDI
jgi:hypothetical protein